MAHEYLTVKEFADLVRCHPRTIYRRIWTDRQPGVIRIGRDIRIDQTEALRPVQVPEIPPYGASAALGRLFTGV